jgi:hypothetical protein
MRAHEETSATRINAKLQDEIAMKEQLKTAMAALQRKCVAALLHCRVVADGRRRVSPPGLALCR